MKIYAMCGMLGGLAFVSMGFQTGLFQAADSPVAEQETIVEVEKKPPPPKTRFPEDLAKSARQEPVPQAAGFNPDNRSHKLAILRSNGLLHPWQDNLKEEWQAETVEETSLVLVVPPQRKHRVSIHTYTNGAPPIERFQYELEVYVVDAKTGEVLATRQFQNAPRAIKPLEAWELTAIGQPVAFRSVFPWLSSSARGGFQGTPSRLPLVTVVE